MANTQLRVMPPVGRGTKELIACALRCNLSNVAIVEIEEVDTIYWTDFPHALFQNERALIAPVLQEIVRKPSFFALVFLT